MFDNEHVKRETHSLPYSEWPPKTDALFPDHANVGTGTGMGTLIPICPASTFRSKYRAVAPLLVKIDVPLPSTLKRVSRATLYRRHESGLAFVSVDKVDGFLQGIHVYPSQNGAEYFDTITNGSLVI
jgi:hypothetical protein